MEPYDYTPVMGDAEFAAAAMAAALSEADKAPADDTLPSLPHKRSLAMAYVPYQPFDHLYDAGDALAHGTLFKTLDLPFYGARSRK